MRFAKSPGFILELVKFLHERVSMATLESKLVTVVIVVELSGKSIRLSYKK